MDDGIDPHWANWFVGFCDGEASFTYRNTQSKNIPVRPVFMLTIQDDHQLIVEMNEVIFGGGYVSIDKPVKAKRASGTGFANRSELDITDKKRLQVIVDFFERFPLRTHKNAEFKIWRELVNLYCHKPTTPQADRMRDLVRGLIAGRISGMSVRGRARLDSNQRTHTDGHDSDIGL